jgi:hypothetical protein
VEAAYSFEIPSVCCQLRGVIFQKTNLCSHHCENLKPNVSVALLQRNRLPLLICRQQICEPLIHLYQTTQFHPRTKQSSVTAVRTPTIFPCFLVVFFKCKLYVTLYSWPKAEIRNTQHAKSIIHTSCHLHKVCCSSNISGLYSGVPNLNLG